MPPHVSWTRRADQRFGAALSGVVEPQQIPEEREEVARKLEIAFADAIDVVVLNYFVGFKKRKDEHILRVDVRFANHASNSYVVKLAVSERLAKEFDAWSLCNINGTNPVFMPILKVNDPADSQQIRALAYQDAETHIGADAAIWFEAAVQDAVRFNCPTEASIRQVVHQVFTQTKAILYNGARLEPVGHDGIRMMPTRQAPRDLHRLSATLELWKRPAELKLRRKINAAFHMGFTRFLDPVDYFHYLETEQKRSSIVPAQLRGLAHGDLHGRNLLVGIDEREAAGFPSLFDYEHIHHDNLVGWDFVEMETELKIRCYPYLFEGENEVARIRQIQEFEWRLMEATKTADEQHSWTLATVTNPQDRLLSILLSIRHEAHSTLGVPRNWSIEWLHEYLFLLGSYALTTVWRDSQVPAESRALYLSAGVAAAYWEQLRNVKYPEPADPADMTQWSTPSYHAPLKVAHKWNRGSADDHAKAEQHLSALVERYPAALPVWYESAFNHVKQRRFVEGSKALEALHETFEGSLDEDAFSLWGRCFKEVGDRHLESGRTSEEGSAKQRSSFSEADGAYASAIEKYRQAYDIDHGFFSGINLATLLFMRAGLNFRMKRPNESATFRAQSAELAKKLESISVPGNLPDDHIWQRATEAEAAMLQGDWEFAAERYRAALDQPKIQPHHAASMGNQFRRLVEAYKLIETEVPRDKLAMVPELLAYLP